MPGTRAPQADLALPTGVVDLGRYAVACGCFCHELMTKNSGEPEIAASELQVGITNPRDPNF
jgi:hypothetical protein